MTHQTQCLSGPPMYQLLRVCMAATSKAGTGGQIFLCTRTSRTCQRGNPFCCGAGAAAAGGRECCCGRRRRQQVPQPPLGPGQQPLAAVCWLAACLMRGIGCQRSRPVMHCNCSTACKWYGIALTSMCAMIEACCLCTVHTNVCSPTSDWPPRNVSSSVNGRSAVSCQNAMLGWCGG